MINIEILIGVDGFAGAILRQKGTIGKPNTKIQVFDNYYSLIQGIEDAISSSRNSTSSLKKEDIKIPPEKPSIKTFEFEGFFHAHKTVINIEADNLSDARLILYLMLAKDFKLVKAEV